MKLTIINCKYCRFYLWRHRVIFKQNFNSHVHELFLVTFWATAACAWLRLHLHRAGVWPSSLLVPNLCTLLLQIPPWVQCHSPGTCSCCPCPQPQHRPAGKGCGLEPNHLTEAWAVVHRRRRHGWRRSTVPREHGGMGTRDSGTAESQPPVASPVIGTVQAPPRSQDRAWSHDPDRCAPEHRLLRGEKAPFWKGGSIGRKQLPGFHTQKHCEGKRE